MDTDQAPKPEAQASEGRKAQDAPAPLPLGSEQEQRARRAAGDRTSFLVGLCVAIAVNGGGALGLWWMSRKAERPPLRGPEIIVDARLVKFGKKRDMSFLPHVPVEPRTTDKPKTIKLAQDPDKPAVKKDEPKRLEDLSKLADRIKNLRADEDDRARAATEEGDPNGTRGGTAQDAAGDPFIRAIMAAILERWTVPTMLSPGELMKLQAEACLTLAEDGRLISFKMRTPSGNSLFDGSLLSTLGSIKELPRPFGPFARAARAGNLCPVFSKQ